MSKISNVDVVTLYLNFYCVYLIFCLYRGKTVKVFAFGDYEYLTRMYGLTGPNGKPCFNKHYIHIYITLIEKE